MSVKTKINDCIFAAAVLLNIRISQASLAVFCAHNSTSGAQNASADFCVFFIAVSTRQCTYTTFADPKKYKKKLYATYMNRLRTRG